MISGDFFGRPTAFLQNDLIRVEYLTYAGPRIVRVFLDGDPENQLAEMNHKQIETSEGTFNMMGGHRLWHAPESVNVPIFQTDGVSLIQREQEVVLLGPVEAKTGIQKQIRLELKEELARVDSSPSPDQFWILDGGAGTLSQLLNFRWEGRRGFPWMHLSPRHIAKPADYFLVSHENQRSQAKNQRSGCCLVLQRLVRHRLKWFHESPGLGQLYPEGDGGLKNASSPRWTESTPDMNCNTEIYVWDDFCQWRRWVQLPGWRPADLWSMRRYGNGHARQGIQITG